MKNAFWRIIIAVTSTQKKKKTFLNANENKTTNIWI